MSERVRLWGKRVTSVALSLAMIGGTFPVATLQSVANAEPMTPDDTRQGTTFGTSSELVAQNDPAPSTPVDWYTADKFVADSQREVCRLLIQRETTTGPYQMISELFTTNPTTGARPVCRVNLNDVVTSLGIGATGIAGAEMTANSLGTVSNDGTTYFADVYGHGGCDITCTKSGGGTEQLRLIFEHDNIANIGAAKVTFKDADNIVYDKGEHAPEPTVYYDANNNDACDEGEQYDPSYYDVSYNPTPCVNAGTYTVTITGKAGHGIGSTTGTYEIKKAPYAGTITKVPEPRHLIYTGKPQILVMRGSAKGGTMLYSLDGKEYSKDVPRATEIGKYTVWYKVFDPNHEDSEPANVTATITRDDTRAPDDTTDDGAKALVRGHVQDVGDVVGKPSGKGIVVGTEGQSLRLESFSLGLPKDVEGGIEYRGHFQNRGWDEWVADGKTCGTAGKSLRLEAAQMRLTGKLADTHDVWYRAHAQNFGWLGWAKDGQAVGTAGQSLRVEALEVQILRKGETPADHEEGQTSYIGAATANVHMQNAGWTGSQSALEFGTTGQARRLEAVRLSVPGLPVAGGISYEAHTQDRGWMPAAADGALAGTTGQAKRLEAVRISLTGDAAKEGGYSVWYRVHSQDFGWLGWAHDGAEAGTTGLAKRAEAIDVQVLPQGQVPRGYDTSKAACVSA